MLAAHLYPVHILHDLYSTFILDRWEFVCFNWLEHDRRKDMITLPMKGGVIVDDWFCFFQPANVFNVWLRNLLKQNKKIKNSVRSGVVLLNLRAAALLKKSLKDSFQAFQQIPSRTPDNLCM